MLGVIDFSLNFNDFFLGVCDSLVNILDFWRKGFIFKNILFLFFHFCFTIIFTGVFLLLLNGRCAFVGVKVGVDLFSCSSRRVVVGVRNFSLTEVKLDLRTLSDLVKFVTKWEALILIFVWPIEVPYWASRRVVSNFFICLKILPKLIKQKNHSKTRY